MLLIRTSGGLHFSDVCSDIVNRCVDIIQYNRVNPLSQGFLKCEEAATQGCTRFFIIIIITTSTTTTNNNNNFRLVTLLELKSNIIWVCSTFT